MIFEFKNLGSIKEAQIEMGNLTVICGKNNTGKTYLTYAVYGFLSEAIYSFGRQDNNYANEIYQKLKENKFVEIDLIDLKNMIVNYTNDNLKKTFGNRFTKIGTFDFSFPAMDFEDIDEPDIRITQIANTKLKVEAKQHIKFGTMSLDVLASHDFDIVIALKVIRKMLPYTFIMNAERTSIQLFWRELDENRQNQIIRHYEPASNFPRRYPLAIEKSIAFQRDLQEITTHNSSIDTDIIKFIENNILEIDSYYTDKMQQYIILKNGEYVPISATSTSIRSIADLVYYLKHQARKGDLLMIDEPELNLHPENQIKMARLFAKLVNAGIKVWITTHSDYIIKEFNNLIMLGNVSNREEMLSRFKNEKGENEYSENDILKAEDLKAYIAYNLDDGSGATVRKIAVDKYGMVESTFDNTINRMNKISRTLAENVVD